MVGGKYWSCRLFDAKHVKHVAGQQDLPVDHLPDMHITPHDATGARLRDRLADLDGHIVETANIEGEIVADDIVVTGRVVGRVRGLKVRLTSTARVEGDIIHKTIAIESGAHFEGSVQRAEDPLSTGSSAGAPRTSVSTGPSEPPAPAAPSIPRPAAAGPVPGKSDS